MKVELVVVRGRPEGKTIPVTSPRFVIGRNPECHLRPNSEEVSRRHVEFLLGESTVQVRELGSRNGTLVNGTKLGNEPLTLQEGDLVQIGQLAFAIKITGVTPVAPQPQQETAPAAAPVVAEAEPAAEPLDGVEDNQIESWLLGDPQNPAPERPSGIYDGQTMTIETAAFLESEEAETQTEPEPKPEPEPAAERAEPDDEPVHHDNLYDPDAEDEEDDEHGVSFEDESNPFVAARKKAAQETETKTKGDTSKASFADTSSAASDILKRMMARRRSD